MIVVPETLLIDAQLENLRLRAAISAAIKAIQLGSNFEAMRLLVTALPSDEERQKGAA